MDIPIVHARDGFQLVIERPTFSAPTHVHQDPPHNPPYRFQFELPGDNVLSNVTSLVFCVGPAHADFGLPQVHGDLDPALPHLSEVISASKHLRVFSLNSPIPSMSARRRRAPRRAEITEDLIQALTSRGKLVSLSLMAVIMRRDQ